MNHDFTHFIGPAIGLSGGNMDYHHISEGAARAHLAEVKAATPFARDWVLCVKNTAHNPKVPASDVNPRLVTIL